MREGVEVTLARAGARRRLRAPDLGRRDPRARGGRRDRRLPAAAPAAERRRRCPADLLQLDADDYRNERSLPDGAGARDRQRPDRLPDRRGARRRRPRGVPLVRPRAVAAAADRRPRHRSGGRSRPASSTSRSSALPSPIGAARARTSLATGRDGGHDLQPADAARAGRRRSSAASAAPTAARRSSPGPARQRRRGATSATASFRELVCEPRRRARARAAGPARARALLRPRRARDARPRRRRRRRLRRRVPARLRLVGRRARARSTRSASRVHDEGASTAAPGLYFVGVHFLRKRKSSLLCGVGEDAAIVAGRIAAARGAPS